MSKYKIPGRIEYGTFSDVDSVSGFLNDFGTEVVVKPIGLTGGKGAKVFGEHLLSRDDIMAYAREIFETRYGGSARLVIERKVTGEEFTLQCFCDGREP